MMVMADGYVPIRYTHRYDATDQESQRDQPPFPVPPGVIFGPIPWYGHHTEWNPYEGQCQHQIIRHCDNPLSWFGFINELDVKFDFEQCRVVPSGRRALDCAPGCSIESRWTNLPHSYRSHGRRHTRPMRNLTLPLMIWMNALNSNRSEGWKGT